MARDKTFRNAEKKIEEALREGSTVLDLGGMILDESSKLSELPDSLWELTQLRALNLSRNKLMRLPESLGNLTQLQSLNLSNNSLRALPGSLGNLTRLENLFLGRNHLTALPESMGKLTQLRGLGLHNNMLIILPNWIGEFTQLKKLSLQNNALRELPDSFRKLTDLTLLFLQQNQTLGIPAEILGRVEPDAPADPATILDYYFSTRGDKGSALRELKLLVVGRGGAGKTSLVKRLNREMLNPTESETHGIGSHLNETTGRFSPGFLPSVPTASTIRSRIYGWL